MKFMFYYLMNLPQIKPRVAPLRSPRSEWVQADALSSINMQKMSRPAAAAQPDEAQEKLETAQCPADVWPRLRMSTVNWFAINDEFLIEHVMKEPRRV